jgi:hypothetical protein
VDSAVNVMMGSPAMAIHVMTLTNVAMRSVTPTVM